MSLKIRKYKFTLKICIIMYNYQHILQKIVKKNDKTIFKKYIK